MKFLASALLALLLVPLESASAGSPQSEAGTDGKLHSVPFPASKEELLGEVPPEIKVPVEFGFYLSPDGRRFAALGKTDKKQWVVMVDGKVGPKFEEHEFQDGSRGPGVRSVIFSLNSLHVAYAAHSGQGKWIVVLDDRNGPGYENVILQRFSFSPDSKHLAYCARRSTDKWVMVVDGKEGPEFQEISAPLFSPDSQHLAYAARIAEKNWILVADGQAGPEFVAVGAIFSPDSKHLAYCARRSTDKWVMVVDGKEGPEFQEMRFPLFSPDSKHLAYRAKQNPDRWLMVLDGVPGPEFDELDQDWMFSPNGKHLAYKAKRGPGKWVMILDGQPGPEFEKIKGPFFSPDGDRLAYEALEGAKDHVVLDGKVGPGFDAVSFPLGKSKGLPQWGSSIGEVKFSPNGKHASYLGRRGKKLLVTWDGQEGRNFSFVLAGPVFSPDSEHLVYMGWEQNAINVVLDGNTIKKIPVPEGLPLYTVSGKEATVDRETAWDDTGEIFGPLPPLWPVFFGGKLFSALAAKSVNFVEHVTFSLDGNHLAYVVGVGGRRFNGKELSRAHRQVIVDGKEGQSYDAEALLNLTFSSDNSHFAFEVRKTNQGKSFVVLDGHEGKPYDELLAPKWALGQETKVESALRFGAENSITYLAREGRKFYRVTQHLP